MNMLTSPPDPRSPPNSSLPLDLTPWSSGLGFLQDFTSDSRSLTFLSQKAAERVAGWGAGGVQVVIRKEPLQVY